MAAGREDCVTREGHTMMMTYTCAAIHVCRVVQTVLCNGVRRLRLRLQGPAAGTMRREGVNRRTQRTVEGVWPSGGVAEKNPGNSSAGNTIHLRDYIIRTLQYIILYYVIHT